MPGKGQAQPHRPTGRGHAGVDSGGHDSGQKPGQFPCEWMRISIKNVMFIFMCRREQRPKDGPSAGVGMCTSLVSALTKIPVRADVAMTGEITLSGEVLPIGGLKEKLLAAHRGGIATVIIPEENERDLVDIPKNIKQNLDISSSPLDR